MLSFALNHYFAGSFDHSTPFKLTNLLLHILNGLLLFWLARLIFTRLAQSNQKGLLTISYSPRALDVLCAGIVTLWVVHPIQVTSVLYVVQRMTSLSALFVILGLIFYLKGRMLLVAGNRTGVWIILIGLLGCGILGILSKENALLLPIFMIVLEFVLFPSEFPWKSWAALSLRSKQIITICVVLLFLIALISAINYALPHYIYRNFSMLERILTESRVLFIYISLILVPRINKFGIFHDDIEISTSLFHPWTTIPSVLGILVLILIAVIKFREWPLFTLGILWFLTGHLMESTIFPLEIAHEHRNYLASFGILLACTHVIDRGSHMLSHRKLWIVLPLMATVFAGITYFRAVQWANPVSLFHYEVLHNSNSSSAQAGLGARLIQYRQYEEGIKALRRASELEPTEVAYLINMHMAAAEVGKRLSDFDHAETLNRLRDGLLTATSIQAMQNIAECILTTCASLQGDMEIWLGILLNRSDSGEYDASLFYHLLGRTLSGAKIEGAINAYKQSHRLDPKYLHPLFELGYLYLSLRRIEDAKVTLNELQHANQGNKHPRDADIEKFSKDIKAYQKQRHVKPRN
jgi:tetratricopeptide (TPR) repeat protein